MIDEKYLNDYEVISKDFVERKDYNAKIKALKLSITNDKKSQNALNIKICWDSLCKILIGTGGFAFIWKLLSLNKAYKR